MSKLKNKLGVLITSALFLLTGCAGKGTLGQLTDSESSASTDVSLNSDLQAELSPITVVRENFDEEADKIKSQTFDNCSFKNTYFSFPEISEIYTLEYENHITESTQSADESYNYLCKRVDELFPGLFNDEEKAYEIRFGDAEPVNKDSAEGIYRWPNWKQYKEMNLITEHPIPMIANKDCYIELYWGVLRGYDQGDLAKLSGYKEVLDLFDPVSTFPIVYRTADLECEKTFHLVSGDISIADAVKSANKRLSELELSPGDLPFKPCVQSVNVIDIGNGCFAFCFTIVTEYKNVKFNAMEMDKTFYGVSTCYDDTNEIDVFGEARMCEADKITRYRMDSPFLHSDVKESERHDSVISLQKAAEITSDYLTAGMQFEALSVTAVYKRFSDKKAEQYPDDQSYENRKITVKPCWRFVLKPTSGATNELYYVFVDMLTGKVYTSIQLMESDVEYD